MKNVKKYEGLRLVFFPLIIVTERVLQLLEEDCNSVFGVSVLVSRKNI